MGVVIEICARHPGVGNESNTLKCYMPVVCGIYMAAACTRTNAFGENGSCSYMLLH
jgi:hypothetical protein